MQMRALISIVLLVCFGSPLGEANGADPNEESRIIALERIQKIQAFEARDLKTLDGILDDAFAHVDMEGRMRSKAEVLAYIQMADSLRYSAEAMVVRLHGDTAIVTGLFRMTGMERGRPIVQRGRFVDTWLQKDGRWIAIASLSTPTGD
jgi:ketosteroid isomerase-like protein